MAKGPPRQILLNTTGDDKFSSWGVAVDSFSEMVDYAYRSDRFHIRWDLAPRSPLVLDSVAWLAMERGRERGSVLLAVDEIHYYLPKQWNAIPKSFQDACLIGRHANVQLIAASQRPALIHNDFLSQAQRWEVFRLVLRDDLDSIRHLLPEIREQAPTLPIGKHLTYP
jgi:DNA helicase HerA-like ATPase